jgi:DNA-binding NarL/FixJ family response regulator
VTSSDDTWQLSKCRFSKRQHEIIYLIAQGCTTREIAAELGIAPATVAVHVQNAMTRSRCRTRAQLAVFWMVCGRYRAPSDADT